MTVKSSDCVLSMMTNKQQYIILKGDNLITYLFYLFPSYNYKRSSNNQHFINPQETEIQDRLFRLGSFYEKWALKNTKLYEMHADSNISIVKLAF